MISSFPGGYNCSKHKKVYDAMVEIYDAAEDNKKSKTEKVVLNFLKFLKVESVYESPSSLFGLFFEKI